MLGIYVIIYHHMRSDRFITHCLRGASQRNNPGQILTLSGHVSLLTTIRVISLWNSCDAVTSWNQSPVLTKIC